MTICFCCSIAVGHDEVGELALLQGPDLVVEAENPRGINRNGLEGFLVRKTVRDGIRGVLSQPREGIIEAGEGELHTGSGKVRGLGKQTIRRDRPRQAGASASAGG